MATNTGSNGGKNNPGSGVMRGPGNVDQSQGIGSALNQAAYRREYNEKMFSDNGFSLFLMLVLTLFYQHHFFR